MARSTLILAPLVLLAPVATKVANADPNAHLPAPAARLWGENSLWKTSLGKPQTVLKLSDATNMLADQFSLLGQLRMWSGTLRGTGATPRRVFKFGEFNKTNLNFVVGAQQLPTFDLAGFGNTSAGMSLQMGWLTIGSTQGQQSINRALMAYDKLMTGEPSAAAIAAASDESSTTWIAAQPLNSSLGKLDLIMARGTRDLTPTSTSDKLLINGMQYGAHGEFNLPVKWKLRSEWVQSRLSNQATAATAWKLNFNGPIKHPWGVATATANFSDIEGGFATLGNPTPAEGRQNSDFSIQQNIAKGNITGSLALSVVDNERTDAELLAPGTEIANDKTETNAALRWKLSPSLGMFAKHNSRSTSQDILVDAAAGTETVNNATVTTGDVGLEMQVSKSLALTVSGGETRTETATILADPNVSGPVSQTSDVRLAVGLQRRTSAGLFGVQLAQHKLTDRIANHTVTSAGSLQVNAERRISSKLRLKGSYLWSDNSDLISQMRLARATRSAEAQLAVPSLGRFDLLYSDWAGNNNGVDPVTGASLNGARQYGVRINMGSADKGSGLGVAVEYQLQDVKAGNDTSTVRVGLTYK